MWKCDLPKRKFNEKHRLIVERLLTDFNILKSSGKFYNADLSLEDQLTNINWDYGTDITMKEVELYKLLK